MKAYPRGALVTVQYGPDFGEREVAGVAQRDDLGVGRWQLGDRAREDPLQVGALGQLVWQWIVVGRVDDQRDLVRRRPGGRAGRCAGGG